MTKFMPLAEAVKSYIEPGRTVAMEGFTHLIPHAVGHEVVRQGIRELTLIRMTPDVIYDQLIGMGCASKIIFSWGGNPGVGSLHRLRDAVENEWPHPIDVVEHSHAAMAAAYTAGASNLPFGLLRGYAGVDLPEHNDTIKTVTCPFTGEELTAVPAHRPDVGVIHAQRADRRGNIQIFGIVGVQKEVALASERVIVTVEEVVDELPPTPGAVVLPHWTLDAISEVPNGAHPSYAHGYTERDNEFYIGWDAISRDRDAFRDWMERHVLSTASFEEYLESIAGVSP